MQKRLVWSVVSALSLSLACAPDIGRDEVPQYVVAEFDPGATVPVVPTPNDLAINTQTGLVELTDPEGATDAEKEFNKYLRTLDGFPTAATATALFDGDLDPATVTAQAVKAFDVTTSPATELPLTELKWDGAKKQITAKADWQPARTYVLALIGGDSGLKGAAGQRVVGSPTFVIARAAKSLVTCTDLSSPDCRPVTSLISGSTEEETRAKAVALERYRIELQPALAALEAAGTPRQNLAGAWAFSTVKMPLATFDPAKKVVPFPNDLLMQDGHVNLPADPADDAATAGLKLELNKLDGFSTTAAILTESSPTLGAATARLDPASLSDAQFLLVNLSNPSEEVPATVSCHSCTATAAEQNQLRITPSKPLRSHTKYAAFWLRGAKGLADQKLANTGSVFALMRLSHPLVVNGVSQIPAVDVLTASLIEPLRQSYQPLFQLTDEKGLAREDVLLAWTFTTLTTTEPLAALRNKPQEWNLPTAVGATLTDVDYSLLVQASAYTFKDWHSQIRAMKEGQFTSGNALSAGFEVDPASGTSVPTEAAFTDATLTTPKQETLKFLLVLPKTPKFSDGRIPLVIFQHGLGGQRKNAGVIANSIATAGYATIAIDAPFHGERSFCRSNSDCASGSCNADHRCPGGYVIAQGDPTGTPAISGLGFVSGTNPFATRDHFRQQVIDLAQLIRSLQDTTTGIGSLNVDDPATTNVVEKLDPTQIRYIGQSLGGIIGTLALATIPEISSATLNVPGADLVSITRLAPRFAPEKQKLDAYLASRGIPTDSQAYEQYLDTGRWVIDPADPQNFGRHLIAEPLVDVRTNLPGPVKRPFVSWTFGDDVVPNVTTETLIRSIDLGNAPQNFRQTQYAGGDHIFLLNLLGNATLAFQAQKDAVDWVKP